MPPRKRFRRTATAVMAGDFDVPPPRDVLTSLLNGVQRYDAVEENTDEKKAKKLRKEEKRKEKERKKALAAVVAGAGAGRSSTHPPLSISVPPIVNAKAANFWKSKVPAVPKSRPEIMIASIQRSVSVTPPPMSPQATTPEATPGPSISSSVSHESFKRPYTPDDSEDLDFRHISGPGGPSEHSKRERKKRPAAKKGWKGWVEGSPPPSEKLINLDAVPVLQERRTRSGKNFDGIGLGKDGWV
ncbi:hypothetical protein BKA70DRAFT_1366334 [Coprinopsis sp. MPI-PUGE-AT-0042]|nr:hypothetical protein BKA70DRAFT_1366334 [Coprinopsis sp. MPI-PUGE-AT-0042]